MASRNRSGTFSFIFETAENEDGVEDAIEENEDAEDQEDMTLNTAQIVGNIPEIDSSNSGMDDYFEQEFQSVILDEENENARDAQNHEFLGARDNDMDIIHEYRYELQVSSK